MTATATEKIRCDIIENLKLKEEITIRGSANRPNIFYVVKFKTSLPNPFEYLVKLLQSERESTGLIYTYKRSECESLAERLCNVGLIACHYHAGVGAKQRAQVLADWSDGRLKIVVATIAFGMGIDKKDVRFVVHWHVPASFENFYQESGRCGRDGSQATHVLFYSEEEYLKMKKLLIRSTRKGSIRREGALESLGKLQSYCYTTKCRRSVIMEYFNEFGSLGTHSTCCDVCRHYLTTGQRFPAPLRSLQLLPRKKVVSTEGKKTRKRKRKTHKSFKKKKN
jgi:RecQ family ATP-dependent DNA helicase